MFVWDATYLWTIRETTNSEGNHFELTPKKVYHKLLLHISPPIPSDGGQHFVLFQTEIIIACHTSTSPCNSKYLSSTSFEPEMSFLFCFFCHWQLRNFRTLNVKYLPLNSIGCFYLHFILEYTICLVTGTSLMSRDCCPTEGRLVGLLMSLALFTKAWLTQKDK